jgi:DNA-binding MarR family transcriptional regulator
MLRQIKMLKTNNKKCRDEDALVPSILKLSEDIFQVIKLSIPPEWLTSDMTVAQLRILLLLHSEGPSRMSSIAATLGIATPTATGIMDNLMKKKLVVRRTDPEDRRVVICALSSRGQEVIDRIWKLGRFQMEKLMYGLSREELKKVKEVAEILLLNVRSQVVNSKKMASKTG